MQIIVISNPLRLKKEAQIINRLFEEGLTVLHLRKPNYTQTAYARLLSEIEVAHYSKIALHQHHDLADDFGITRLHYPEQQRLTLGESQKLQGKINSTSIHLLPSLNNIDNFDYYFLGPVFNSISKPNYLGVFEEDFKLANPLAKTKVIAIGGININNISTAKTMGFDGAAVLGAIWNDLPNAITNFKLLQDEFSR